MANLLQATKIRRYKWLSVIVTLASTLVLASCGGGGGGGTAVTPTPTPTQTPQATLASIVPASGATGVARDVKPVITLTVANATSSDGSKLALVCGGKTIAITAVSVLSADTKSMTVTLTPQGGAVQAGDSCTLAGDVSTAGAGGTAKTTISTAFSIFVAPSAVAKSLSLIVGAADSPGSKDGALLDASFNGPRALSVAADGTIFVADGCASGVTTHALYRKISPTGQVTTIAGTAAYLNVGHPTSNSAYKVGTTDQFYGDCPAGIVALSDGTVYVSGKNAVVEKITPQGQLSTVVGSWGQPGAVDGSGATARLTGGPVTVDTQGNLYIADVGNHVIRKMDPSGNLTTYAGQLGTIGTTDGTLQAARFWYPSSLKFDKNSGNLFVGDGNGIRVISNGVVSTLVDRPTIAQAFGFKLPIGPEVFLPLNGLDVATDGRIAVTYANQRRALIFRGNTLAVTLGDGGTDDVDGPPGAAKFFFPSGAAFLPNGDLLISDIGNNNIKRYSATTNTVSLWAGKRNYLAPQDGTGSAAKLSNPFCMVQSTAGDIWFTQGGSVRKLDTAGVLSTVLTVPNGDANVIKVNSDGSFVAGSYGRKEITLYGLNGDLQRVLATQVDLPFPMLSTVNAAGDIFFAVSVGQTAVVKKFSNGVISDFATVTGGYALGLTITDAGDLIVANFAGLSKVTPAGAVTMLVPDGPRGIFTDGAVGAVSLGIFWGFNASPVIGRDGAIYIVSGVDSVIRKIYNGRVEKVVGTQWVNETTFGPGPGAIFDARAIKYDAKTNSLIIMTGNAILRAELP